MLSDEGIVHDRLPVLLEDFLKVVDVVVLVGGNQVGHGQDLRVVLVGFGLLHSQVGDHQLVFSLQVHLTSLLLRCCLSLLIFDCLRPACLQGGTRKMP